MKTKTIRLSISAVIIIILVAASISQAAAKYIFLLIGDGMGENQRVVADMYYQSKQVLSGTAAEDVKGLEINNLPAKGYITTFAFNAETTDSAASGTALACGYKTDNGVISMTSGGTDNLETVAEFAKKSGMKVGILSSVWINHATPACFYSHQKSRNDYFEIACQLGRSEIDFFGGTDINPSHTGKGEPYDIARQNGFTVIDDCSAPVQFDKADGKLWIFNKQYSALPYTIDNETASPTLADYTNICIRQLENEDGFFIMIEGGKIDWACHSNDLASCIKETIAFNDVLKDVMDFYNENKQDTLIIVTADHETGGLDLNENTIDINTFASMIDGQKGSESSFREMLKEIEKSGSDFETALEKMADFFGLDDMTDEERAQVYLAHLKGGSQTGSFKYNSNTRLYLAFSRILAERAGIGWTSLSHSSAPVPITAIGQDAELFAGKLDNTCIARYIKDIIKESASEMHE